MKYTWNTPKNAKLGLPQKVSRLGEIELRIGFWNAQKPLQGNFQVKRRKKRFWPRASQLWKCTMVPHWENNQFWTHAQIFLINHKKGPLVPNNYSRQLSISSEYIWGHLSNLCLHIYEIYTKYPKNAKLGLPQKVCTLGKTGLQIGFWHAQKPPQGNFQFTRRKKRFWPPASQLQKCVMVPHWENCQFWTHAQIFFLGISEGPYILNNYLGQLSIRSEYMWGHLGQLCIMYEIYMKYPKMCIIRPTAKSKHAR